jgi:hypothetical protein
MKVNLIKLVVRFSRKNMFPRAKRVRHWIGRHVGMPQSAVLRPCPYQSCAETGQATVRTEFDAARSALKLAKLFEKAAQQQNGQAAKR